MYWFISFALRQHYMLHIFSSHTWSVTLFAKHTDVLQKCVLIRNWINQKSTNMKTARPSQMSFARFFWLLLEIAKFMRLAAGLEMQDFPFSTKKSKMKIKCIKSYNNGGQSWPFTRAWTFTNNFGQVIVWRYRTNTKFNTISFIFSMNCVVVQKSKNFDSENYLQKSV